MSEASKTGKRWIQRTLRAGVHNGFGNRAQQEELDSAYCEPEAGPVMAVFHNFKAVPVEIDVAVKVHLVKRLHGDSVLAMVLGLVGGVLEGEVVLDGAAGKPRLLILTRADG